MLAAAINLLDSLNRHPIGWVILLLFLIVSFIPFILSALKSWREHRDNFHRLNLRKLTLEVEKLEYEVLSFRPEEKTVNEDLGFLNPPAKIYAEKNEGVEQQKPSLIFRLLGVIFGILSLASWGGFISIGLLFFWTPIHLIFEGDLNLLDGIGLQIIFIVIAITTFNGGKFFGSLWGRFYHGST